MLTLNPPIRCGTEGAEEFSSPERYSFLQSHSGEGKSEIWQSSYPPIGTIQPVPHLHAQLGCSLVPKLLASQDEAARDTSLPYLCPPIPACPLPTVPLHCPAQLGREGAPRREVLMLRGCPSPAALHEIQVAAASSKFSGDLLHHAKFPDNSPKKDFLPFAEQN